VLWPKRRIAEQTLVAKAASRGVGVYGIGRYFVTRPSRVGLVLGYARMREREIQEGIQRLGDIL